MSVEISESERVVFVRVSAPVAPGAESTRLAWALLDLCAELQRRLDPLCGVIFHSGEGAFCMQAPRSADDCDAVDQSWAQLTRAVGRLDAPTVAVLGGDAIGPAWELALACDLRVADPRVSVGSPEVRWGRMPHAGGTQRLARVAGQATALELLLFGQTLPAPEALERGLLHRVGPLNACVDEMVCALRASAPIALNFAKEAAHQSAELDLHGGLRLEADLAALLLTTHDRAEGISAFLEKRTARFDAR